MTFKYAQSSALALTVPRIAIASALLIGATLGYARDITVWGSSTATVAGTSNLRFNGTSFSATTSGGVASFTGSNRVGSFYLPAGAAPAPGSVAVGATV